MSIRTNFFDSENGDRIYSAAEFVKDLHAIYTDGYIQDNAKDGLKVVAQNPVTTKIEVTEGRAFVQGYYFEIYDANEVVEISPNGTGNTRKDAVFVTINFTTRMGVITYKTGDATNYPTPQRDADKYELELCKIDVPASFTSISQSNLKDERNNLLLCGKSRPTTLRQAFQKDSMTGWKRIAVSNGFFERQRMIDIITHLQMSL